MAEPQTVAPDTVHLPNDLAGLTEDIARTLAARYHPAGQPVHNSDAASDAPTLTDEGGPDHYTIRVAPSGDGRLTVTPLTFRELVADVLTELQLRR